MKYGILFLILLVIGCGGSVSVTHTEPEDPSPPYESLNNPGLEDTNYRVIIDSSYTNKEKIIIEESFFEWSQASGGEFIYSIEFSKSVPESGDHVISVRNADPGEGYDGFCSVHLDESINRTSYALITIKNILSSKRFKPVILHEIGHALWLDHYEGKYKSIMDPFAGETNRIECVDAQALCEIWGCTTVCKE